MNKISEENLSYIQSKLIETFTDESKPIRKLAATVLTSLVLKVGVNKCKDLVIFLGNTMNLSEQATEEILLAVLDCTYKILEDRKENWRQYRQNSQSGDLMEELL